MTKEREKKMTRLAWKEILSWTACTIIVGGIIMLSMAWGHHLGKEKGREETTEAINNFLSEYSVKLDYKEKEPDENGRVWNLASGKGAIWPDKEDFESVVKYDYEYPKLDLKYQKE